jgi:hypothetical protein
MSIEYGNETANSQLQQINEEAVIIYFDALLELLSGVRE